MYYDGWLKRRAPSAVKYGPGAATIGEVRPPLMHRLSEPKRLALFIAIGIGLHNFSEGLAIGQSAEFLLSLPLAAGVYRIGRRTGVLQPGAGHRGVDRRATIVS